MIRSLELEECPGTCAVLLTAEDNYTRTGATFAKTAVGSASVCPEGHVMHVQQDKKICAYTWKNSGIRKILVLA
jgi:hypothetical protein